MRVTTVSVGVAAGLRLTAKPLGGYGLAELPIRTWRFSWALIRIFLTWREKTCPGPVVIGFMARKALLTRGIWCVYPS